MFINAITLCNYRAYKGHHKIEFSQGDKNIFLIAGNNGFGKTTFLTSLVWCLYGKLMADVDDKFRKDINDAQGYKNFVRQSMNLALSKELDSLSISPELKKRIQKSGYVDDFDSLAGKAQFYIEVEISDVFIPSIPCSNISIKRAYDYVLEHESIEVLIDGHVNELAREVGYDIFINDFILSKDIAKFFFFDAEKIVTLAEVKSIEEKRKLSYAYGEVLGIKKYEDIKKNLENLRLKFRKQSGVSVNKAHLEKTILEVEVAETAIKKFEAELSSVDEEILSLKAQNDEIQEKLIREGNAMSLEELEKQKLLLKTLKDKELVLKAQLKEMLDIAPFAISGKLLLALKEQVDGERSAKSTANASAEINLALETTRTQLLDAIKTQLGFQNYNYLGEIIDNIFSKNIHHDSGQDISDILLDFTNTENNAFQALYDNIRFSYNTIFKQLVKDIKNNAIFSAKTQKKIAAAEMDDTDFEIKKLRNLRASVESKLQYLENQARSISENIGILGKELSIKKKRLAELTKMVKVDDSFIDKDIISERLIQELDSFLFKLRTSRKSSLERKIKSEMDKLMHKIDFIHDVRVEISNDIMEIKLLDSSNNEINKEKLSKGEQQLYATSILKSLVDESGIAFPVFIDSPLQKFDSIHAHNIITKFYPSVSKQVVIFPLLGKELSPEEYQSLLPNINSTFIIDSIDGASSIRKVEPDKLFY